MCVLGYNLTAVFQPAASRDGVSGDLGASFAFFVSGTAIKGWCSIEAVLMSASVKPISPGIARC